jgi:hypothetical protein
MPATSTEYMVESLLPYYTSSETNRIYILFTVATLTTTSKSYSCVVKQNQERSTETDRATLHVGEYIFIKK